MKLFDSHAHLDDEKFNEDREQLIEQIHNENVEKFVSAGYSLETSKKAIELSKKYEYIYPTCGISPNDIPQTEEELWKELEEIRKLVKQNSKTVAIGEIGLDYHWNQENKELQKTSRKMTNSLSLRQCHLPGQSSFLFSKCFSRFPQSLKDQKDTFFIPVHAITIPQYPHIANSGLPSTITF